MKILVPILLLVSSFSFGQIIYVEPTEYGYEKLISEKLRYDGYKLSSTEEGADYKIECFATGQYNAFSFKDMFHGYAKLTDIKSGSEISRTKEIGTNAYNVRQAGKRIMAIIVKKHMKDITPKNH